MPQDAVSRSVSVRPQAVGPLVAGALESIRGTYVPMIAFMVALAAIATLLADRVERLPVARRS